MNRIDETFAACQAEGRKALVMFVSAGDPHLDVTAQLIPAIAAAGADVIEVGIPFSDPMADGPAIQEASQRALAAGTTMRGILEMIRQVRRETDRAMVLFSYYNVILQYGVEQLAHDSVAAGVDGWLVVDVPAEESAEVRPIIEKQGLHWITLLAPTTPKDRMRKLLANAAGFVYYITVTGVTGARDKLPEDLTDSLRNVKTMSSSPVVAGFGISSPEMAAQVAEHADGVVVGSALVQRLAKADSPESGIRECAEFVAALAGALR